MALLSFAWTSSAHAGQPRDFMIAAQPEGTDLFMDIVLPGLQTTLEHRVPVYGQANQLTLRSNALMTGAFFESQADVEMRILVLTLGASVGYGNVLTNQSFDPDDTFDRYDRRIRFVDGNQDNAAWGFGELRGTLSLPINDYILFNGINTLRLQGGPDRTYDWRNALVRDHDAMYRADLMLFFKHRDFGGFAPMMQILNFELNDRRYTQFNYGFLFAMRPGFRRSDDIFFLQFLFHPGSTLGGYDNTHAYGNHLLFSPINVTLAYRVIFEVWRPEE